ncbi:MAG: CTP synthase [Candidatus Parvarchaeota archaeon]|nr:CTP synthase [Candidatus Parvarchaeota archaeon]MCW1301535.1 CTP synthase [Candidatus Parvarchaeota archaeon]
MQAKFIVVTGSLMSGLGKGILVSSIMKVLDMYDLKVLPIKFDGYLNFDCGTMNPYRHGEVFVLEDGGEVDMDFGTYERFLDRDLDRDSSITGGKIISSIIEKERRGDFLGEDVQVTPHLTGEVIKYIEDFAEKKKIDIVVIEVGGTVGDIENGYFIEAMRQLSLKRKVEFINLTYVPVISSVGEQKTKPSQIGIRLLMQAGIKPDILVSRTHEPLSEKTREKLAFFSSLDKSRIISDEDLNNIYRFPINLLKQGVDRILLDDLGIKGLKINRDKLRSWEEIADDTVGIEGESIRIGIVGKYIDLKDSYVSVREAVYHASHALGINTDIKWIEATNLRDEKQVSNELAGLDGVIIPGGFGARGIEGKIMAIKYARENKIPLLGLCLGMQLMAVEFARNVCKLKGANSTEFDPKTKYKIIDLMPAQVAVKNKGGTMRLGAWKARITVNDSIAYRAYKKKIISERHRHRYELNNRYRHLLEKAGLIVSATTLDGKLVEIMEWKNSYGIGTQAHPELKSRPSRPSPLFLSFINAASEVKKQSLNTSTKSE